MKVLHILYQSLPQVSGSSIRSRDVLMSQKQIGIDVVALTSTFQGSVAGNNEDVIHDIRHIRTTSNKETSISDQKKSKFSQFNRILSLIPFTFKLYKIVQKEKPEILHAHAMFYCGISAILIGKLMKIPVVYEFRSLWMFQKKEGIKTRVDHFLENTMLKLESSTLKKADYTIFLNDDLKTFFTNKQIRFKKSIVINNAVNIELIENLKCEYSTETKKDDLVFGYIGTLTSYEGIEFLVETFQELFDEGIKNKLLIYGDGISRKNIEAKIEERKDIHNIQYKGKIKPHEVVKAFALIDVIINPRLSTKVTNSVTPLKPLEAFAYEKLFLGSDVKGITALVEDNVNGFIFKAENKASLKSEIKKILKLSFEEKNGISKNAFEFVKNEKSWKKNALKYNEIYLSLLAEC